MLISFHFLCKIVTCFQVRLHQCFLRPVLPRQRDSLSISRSLTLSLLLFQHLNLYLLSYPTVTFSVYLFFPSYLSLFSFLQTEQFVHTLKDELVKSALLALHAAQPGYVSKNQKSTRAQSQHQGHTNQTNDQNQNPIQGLPGHSPPTSVTETTVVCNNVEGTQTTAGGEPLSLKHQDTIPHHKEYDEEEWVRPTAFLSHLETFKNCD